MSVKLGTADVTSLKLGSTTLSKLMLGTTQVWPVGIPGLVLMESFDDVTDWSVGSAVQVPGRTGVSEQVVGSTQTLTYLNTPAGQQSDVITVGFAFRFTDTNTGLTRDVVRLTSDANATVHNRFQITSTGAMLWTRGNSGIGSSAAGLFTNNTWYYIEIQAKLHDSAGYIIVRRNGVEIINATGQDTKNAGTKTVYDAVVLRPAVSGATNQYDDFYLLMGASASFLGEQRVDGANNQVLDEPFDNFNAWTAGQGAPAIVSGGRHGTALELDVTDRADFAVPVAQRSYYVVIGFAMKVTGALQIKDWLQFYVGSTLKIFVRCTAAGALSFQGNQAVTADGVVVPGEWAYFEFQFLVNALSCNQGVIRKNGVQVGSFSGVNLSLSAPYAIEKFYLYNLGTTCLVDDLYLRTGTLAELEGDPNPPATVYSDDFNRANGAPGANWGEAAAGSYLIASNKLVRQSGGSDMIDFLTAMPSADHWVEVDVTGTGAGGVYAVVHARSSGSSYGENCYMGFLVPGSNTATIGKNVGNSYSDVASATVTNTGAHKLRLEVQGSAQRLYVDGVLAVSAADTSVATGTSVGFNCNGSPGAYDNFRCGALPYTP